ncbi:MAG: hypothetical protein ABT01_00570 [Clostridium sp. SCN 57-10]|nr:MAG: hypothetical protein ABT01_00570 [Clostridium sp. SCN 57-10]
MLGMALEGGGARGSFHVGVMQAYIEEGVHFDAIAGTSIGAVNAAMFAQGDYDRCRELWLSLTSDDLFTEEEQKLINLFAERKLSMERIAFARAKLRDALLSGGVDTSRVRAVFDANIDSEKLLRSPVDFGLVTFGLTDMRPLEIMKRDMTPDNLVSYVMASATFPGFQLMSIDDKKFIDGGFYDNCPTNLLADNGCDTIIAVRTRALGIYRQLRAKNVKLITIQPSESLGPTMQFDPKTAEYNMRLGYLDAMRVLRGYHGVQYYLTSAPSEGEAFARLCSLTADIIFAAAEDARASSSAPARRLLFEKLLPDLARELHLPKTAGYADILIAVLEERAARCGIERLSLYSFDELWQLARKAEPQNRHSSPLRSVPLAAVDPIIESLR